jgi:hypothetical protein
VATALLVFEAHSLQKGTGDIMKIKDIKQGRTYRTRRHSWSGGDLVRIVDTTHAGHYTWQRTKHPSFICQRLFIDFEKRSAKDVNSDFGSGTIKLQANQIEREMTIDEYIDVCEKERDEATTARKRKEQRHKEMRLNRERFVDICVELGLPKPLSRFDNVVVFYHDEIESFLKKLDTDESAL